MAQEWEQQKGESTPAFEAFRIYRDLGEERSLVKVAQKCNKSNSLIARWSGKNRWVDRVTAYDNYLDKMLLREEAKARKKMARDHAAIAVKFLNTLAERLETMDPEELAPNDMARWLDIAVKVERLSRGESTDNQQHSGGVTVQIIDDLDELEV